MEDWIYVGIFLTNKSKNKLKKLFKIPEGWTEYFDHMTIVFNDGSDYAQTIKNICDQLGEQKIKLQVISQGISEKAYAIHVNIPIGIPCANKISHITLACSSDGNPVDSNYIENWHDISKPFAIKGTLKVFKPEKEYDEPKLMVCGVSPLAYDANEVIKKLESYKNYRVMLADCEKYGVKNIPNQSFYSNNKTEQAIKEQLYTLLYHYDWLGADEDYIKLIDRRIQMFQEIIDNKEKERMDELIKEGKLCPKCKHGEMKYHNTGLVEIDHEWFSGGPAGPGVHVSGEGIKEYQFHYKKCEECGYWEMTEYRETPSWWDDLWNLDCPFTSGNIIEKFQKGELSSKKYKSHKITRW